MYNIQVNFGFKNVNRNSQIGLNIHFYDFKFVAVKILRIKYLPYFESDLKNRKF